MWRIDGKEVDLPVSFAKRGHADTELKINQQFQIKNDIAKEIPSNIIVKFVIM